MDKIVKLSPVFKQMIWGGNRMREVFGYDIPGDDTGECWAISAHKNGDCTIAYGEFAGRTLSWLWENKQDWFGNVSTGGVFPLLTKVIDAKQNLSIQVHPNDAYAMEHENGSLGKTECWYILDCDPGATIIIGHNAKDKAELEDMIRNGRWSEFIREIPIQKGDFLQIYPGTVHAIKGGTMILETQQNSDITYRVYDYDRLQNGKPRQLHVQQSIDVITVPFAGSEAKDKGEAFKQPGGLVNTSATCTPLVRCEYYKVWKLDVNGIAAYAQENPFMLCSVIEGEGELTAAGLDDKSESMKLHKGDHFILTKGCSRVTINGDVSMICSAI